MTDSTPRSHWWSPAALAWSFLTTIPAPLVTPTPRELARSIALFPLVGGLLGALVGGVGLGLDRLLPAGPIAVVLLVASALATGGLHLDGLMDSADGLFGGHTVERRLEIMGDSRIGSFGMIAGGLALVAEFACLSELTGLARLGALILALGLSRWAMALAIGSFPSARPNGLGATFRRGGGPGPIAVATLFAGGLTLATGVLGIASLALVGVLVLVGGRYLTARLGGLTGDSYGALAVVAEVGVLFVAVGFRGASPG